MQITPLRRLEGRLREVDLSGVGERGEPELRHRFDVVGIGGHPNEREREARRNVDLAEGAREKERLTLRGLHFDAVRRASSRREVDGEDAEASWSPPAGELIGRSEALEYALARSGHETRQLKRQSV